MTPHDRAAEVGSHANPPLKELRDNGPVPRMFERLRRQGFPPISKLHHLSLWSVVLWLSLVNTLWALLAGFSVVPASLADGVIISGLVMSPLLHGKARAKPRLREALLTIGGLLAFSPACVMLSYLILAMPFSLVDEQLAAIDAALGFHWAEVAQWVRAHGWLDELFWWAYRSAFLQITVLVIVLAATGRYRQLREFSAFFVCGGILSAGCSALAPAFGPWHAAPASLFDVNMMSHFAQLRSGELRVIDLAAMQGLVSIPSFHTMGAVFIVYAMRGLRGWAPLYAVLNLLMIASTPTEGGHYLADVLAGGFLAFAMIAFSRSKFFSRLDASHGYARDANR